MFSSNDLLQFNLTGGCGADELCENVSPTAYKRFYDKDRYTVVNLTDDHKTYYRLFKAHSDSNFRGGDVSEEPFTLNDDLAELSTNTIISGKEWSPYIKTLVVSLFNYVTTHPPADLKWSPKKAFIANTFRKVFDLINSSTAPTEAVRIIKKLFKCESNECMFVYFVMGYLTHGFRLPLIAMQALTRPLPFQRSDEWFDNFRLDSFGYALDMIMWREYDTDESYTVKYNPEPMNSDVSINHSQFNKHLVNPFREFLIKCHLLPHEYTKRIPTELKMTDDTLSDTAYRYFPFYYGGAHGCDTFWLPDKSLSIPEIKAVLQRYPTIMIGYILNTATYASGRGEHWMALVFMNTDSKPGAKLLCSQRSDFDIFRDGGRLKNELITNGFTLEHNPVETQNNNFSCGDLSMLSLLMMIEYRDISLAISAIGPNATNLGSLVGKQTDIYEIRRKIVGAKA